MTTWNFVYQGWNPDEQSLREALTVIGNGYFCTRGAAEESRAGGPHYPGTYLAGGYNRLKTEIAGRVVENEDLVNWPNWLCLTFRPDGGGWLDLAGMETVSYSQDLDMRAGTLTRDMHVRDARGRETRLTSKRLVHMGQQHLAAIEWTLIPLNWAGRLVIRSGIDGGVSNGGVARYGQLNSRHLEAPESGQPDEQTVDILVQSTQSRLRVALAARTTAFRRGRLIRPRRELINEGGFVGHDLVLDAVQGEPIRIEKVVALHTSRDWAISEPRVASRRALGSAGSFAELADSQARAWRDLWRRCDIELEGEVEIQRILRLHLFHLLQTASPYSIDIDAGVPARGWHGEAYRGHVFWDEVFVLPFLNLHFPDVSRDLLLYRFRRLDEARRMAAEAGYQGAMFPWQSGSDGREETQVVHLNPRSGRWKPDHTHLQRHVNSTIAYNVWQYFQATGDDDFMAEYGAEMILEIARFWASKAHYNQETGRFEIRGVIGPDEYHDRYPGADQPGVNNNAYTNVMAAWVLQRAVEVFSRLEMDRAQELIEALRISDAELARWDSISRKMYVPFHRDGIISQFDGYDALDEFDWEGYERKYGDIHRLDRILEAEGDTPNRYQCAKQADVLMLFYLFTAEEIHALFDRLGYPFDPELVRRNIDYYLHRTSHGSTLSRLVHSWVLARSDGPLAWELFQDALRSDVADIQGGTTSEGIHLGAMAGTVDLIQRYFLGISGHGDELCLNPCLPEKVSSVGLRLRYRGRWFHLKVTQQSVDVSYESGTCPNATLRLGGDVFTLAYGESIQFQFPKGHLTGPTRTVRSHRRIASDGEPVMNGAG